VAFTLRDLESYDGVVVASPTRDHAHQARAALDAARPVLVEKPLAMTPAEADELAVSADLVMVGFNLRFHDPVKQLVDLVHEGRIGRVFHARLWFGSWLPDWRPAVDYRQTYSARADLGGGVLMDAIHELDLAIWLFGQELRVVGATVDRIGPLDIDVEDTVAALLRDANGAVVSISLDYLSARYRRGVEVVGAMGTARLDWARQVIEVEDRDGVSSWSASADIASSYEHEAACFLAWLRGEGSPPVNGSVGAASVHLADAIRRVARS
jgi:predicted dehydrogenase